MTTCVGVRHAEPVIDRVVLVEGESDRAALETLAVRLGRDLPGERVAVIAMGGATNVAHHLARYGPGVRLIGLCDANEAAAFRRAFERAGREAELFVCDADLEDELIRALGVAEVERVIAEHGELGSLELLRRQPAQRGRSAQAQVRRFMGSQSGRKLRYARLLVQALEVERAPEVLVAVLAAL